MRDPDEIAVAIRDTLISPNVADSNLEAANLVDTTAQIARGLETIAVALHRIAEALDRLKLGGT